MKFAIQLGVAFLLVSAAWILPIQNGFAVDDVCAAGLAAFTKNVYSPILRVSCVECHDQNEDGPPHSTSDVNASYALFKKYLGDFSQISGSTVIRRVKSQHWLSYDAKATGTTVDIMTAALQSWYDQGEKSCPNSASAQTDLSLVPTDAPIYPVDKFKTLTWSLDGLSKSYKGSSFSVDLQIFAVATPTTAGAYRLRNPRFYSPQAGVKIGGIQLYLNKKLQTTSNAWGNVNAEIAGHATFAPTLSSRYVILLQDQATGDSLSVAFTGLQFTDAPVCKALDIFQAKILPAIQQNSCVLCHSSTATSGLGAGEYLNYQTTDDLACNATRERIDFALPEASPFLVLGFTEALDHPPAINLPTGLAQDWVAWVAAEAKK